ncbi:hypothetical protein [Agromyces sp. CCNWLW203]|uniref:hypothetical protein n=1 Tax=Agromyces sp. CCNWLW203 TaxID=3112842 RepID=UPI002F9630BB
MDPNTALPVPTPPRRRTGPWAGVGIVTGILVLVALVIAGAAFGTATLARGLVAAGSTSSLTAPAGDPPPVEDDTLEEPAATDLPPVEYYTSEEAGFWFEAALEVYHDDRLGGCPAKFERGCWEAALIPETSCGMLSIGYRFSNDPTATDGETRATQRTNVEAGVPVELVFGNDEYEYGWVDHVACLAPPTAAPAT